MAAAPCRLSRCLRARAGRAPAAGCASKWANQLSLAFLSGANRGTLDDVEAAKRSVADQLFAAGVMQPWLALEFGGTRHCVDTDTLDEDGFPAPVATHDTRRDVCRDHVKAGKDGYGGYARRFLHHPLGSPQRLAEYEALRDGKAPENPPVTLCPPSGCPASTGPSQFADYRSTSPTPQRSTSSRPAAPTSA